MSRQRNAPSTAVISLERKKRKKHVNMTKTSVVANSILGLVRPSEASKSFLHKKTAYDQRVHTRAEKGAHRIGRRVHDSFAAQIKGSVHDHWDSRAFFEFIQQTPVQRIDFLLHGLRTRAPVDV